MYFSESSDPSDTRSKFASERRLPRLHAFERLLPTFSPAERLLLYAFTILFAGSTLVMLAWLNAAISVTVPSPAGTFTEGEVGAPRFINPILTLTQADEDIAALVFSGLMRALPDGSLVPDLAERYEISADGTIYRFTLREDARFHDGTPVTSADVLFTVQAAQNPLIKSSQRADWEGVTASAPDPRTIVFTLPRAYAPFLFNTTLGILPQHLWKDTAPEEFAFSPLNTHAVGSGPYAIDDIQTDATGTITSIRLTPFKQFALGTPYLKRITFVFYPNTEALLAGIESGEVDAAAALFPEQLRTIRRDDVRVVRAPLPRIFGVFFNQTHAPLLTDIAVRKALDRALDKEALVRRVLQGYGVPLSSPFPPTRESTVLPSPIEAVEEVPPASYTDATLAEAREILSRNGWTRDQETGVWKKKEQRLAFSVATADSPQLVKTVEEVADAWRALGAEVDVQIFSLSDLNVNVIRPRQYDALLFGEVVGRELDLFAFWHSSQRNDPGLNLALYASTKADAALSAARASTIAKEREQAYEEFASHISEDVPAVFLYAPEFIYVVPEHVSGMRLGWLTTPAERFYNVHEWYTDTERVWSFFANK